jgi:hypothetical protein
MAGAAGATTPGSESAGGVSLIGTIWFHLRFYKRGRWAPQKGWSLLDWNPARPPFNHWSFVIGHLSFIIFGAGGLQNGN